MPVFHLVPAAFCFLSATCESSYLTFTTGRECEKSIFTLKLFSSKQKIESSVTHIRNLFVRYYMPT